MSPKQNRDIPPLDYQRVYQLKQDFPELDISINGGITTFAQANEHMQHIDGVMIGREVYQNPYMLARADNEIWQADSHVKSRHEVLNEMVSYIDNHVANGGRAWHVARHMLGLCNGLAGAKQFRRYLSENANGQDVGGEVLLQAFNRVLQLNLDLNEI